MKTREVGGPPLAPGAVDLALISQDMTTYFLLCGAGAILVKRT